MSEPYLATVAAEWRLPEPLHPRPLTSGTNNQVWVIETPSGNYALRVYSNHTDLARVRFEHAVLGRLQAMALPFALPVPLSTRSGALYARVAAGTDEEALVTLTPFLPGAPPDRDDLAQAYASGEALGSLDVALARIPPLDVDGAVNWRSYGDLEHCHPLVPNPKRALLELPAAKGMRQQLARSYEALIACLPPLYASLPQQLVHEDYAPENVLMVGGHVTAVLDFEFCARDVRVMDLTVALSWWPVDHFGTGDEWPILQAVAEGYGHQARLSAPEVEALPTLYQLRAYTSLIHRLGCYRQGLSPLDAVVGRARAALEREAWLRANGERLVKVIMTYVAV